MEQSLYHLRNVFEINYRIFNKIRMFLYFWYQIKELIHVRFTLMNESFRNHYPLNNKKYQLYFILQVYFKILPSL